MAELTDTQGRPAKARAPRKPVASVAADPARVSLTPDNWIQAATDLLVDGLGCPRRCHGIILPDAAARPIGSGLDGPYSRIDC